MTMKLQQNDVLQGGQGVNSTDLVLQHSGLGFGISYFWEHKITLKRATKDSGYFPNQLGAQWTKFDFQLGK